MQIECILLLAFFGCFGLGSAQNANNTSLFCYSCNPATHSAYACANLVGNIQLVNCSTTIIGNVSNFSFSCFSQYLNYNNVSGNVGTNNRTGIYRGCRGTPLAIPDDFCNSPVGVNISRSSCIQCYYSGCNTHTFNSGGGITGGGSGGGGGGGGSGGGSGGGGGGGASGGGGERPNGGTFTTPSTIMLLLCFVCSFISNYQAKQFW